MDIGIWYDAKPEFDIECIFATASLIRDHYEHSIWEVVKFTVGNTWWYGVLTGNAEEWGDIEDLTATKYLILPSHNKTIT